MSRFWPFTIPARASLLPFRLRALSGVFLAALILAVPGCGHRNSLAPTLTGEELAPSVASAQHPGGPRPVPAYAVHREGVSGSGALWVIDKPARWNGDLVLYAHGYIDPALPLALPAIAAIRDSLLARGYAVAASSFSSNGYAVDEGVRDTHELGQAFSRIVAPPRRTFLMGQSLGGLVAMLLAQKHPGQYDAAFLVAGIVGGSQQEIQYMGDVRVLFDAVYPGVLAGDLEHPPVITDLNAQVVGPVVRAVTANPQGLGIIQALARHPLPGNNAQELVASLVNVLGFAMQGGGDLFERTHFHHYFDNSGYRYASAALPAPLVDDINARVARYAVAPDAAAYLAHYGEPHGPFRIPVLTLHHSRDPVVPVFHEDLLAQVAAGPNLVQDRVEAYGHTTFTAAELMVRFADLVSRTPAPHPEYASN